MHRNEAPVTARRRRDDRGLRGLLVVNVLLLALLAAVSFGPSAEAQVRRRGSYSMAAGTVTGWASSVVYVADIDNQELLILAYEHSQKELLGVGYRNLVTDTATLARGGGSR